MCVLFTKLKTLLVYNNVTENKLKGMSPEEFSRLMLVKFSSSKDILRRKPTKINYMRRLEKVQNFNLNFAGRSYLDYAYAPFDIDKNGELVREGLPFP